MLDMNEIEQEIEKLENSEYTTLNACKNLAILYIVRDHYKKSNPTPAMGMGGIDEMMRSPLMRQPEI